MCAALHHVPVVVEVAAFASAPLHLDRHALRVGAELLAVYISLRLVTRRRVRGLSNGNAISECLMQMRVIEITKWDSILSGKYQLILQVSANGPRLHERLDAGSRNLGTVVLRNSVHIHEITWSKVNH